MPISQRLVSQCTGPKEQGRQNIRGKIKMNGEKNDQNSSSLLEL